MENAPNCYECRHRTNLPGDCHSCCRAGNARVQGNLHAILNGWFFHPFNFDPIWLEACDSFEPASPKEQSPDT